MFKKIKTWYSTQNDMTKALLWIGFALIIGILLRLNHIIEGINKGFEFYNMK